MSFLQRELQYELPRPRASFHYSIYWLCHCHDCIPGPLHTVFVYTIVPFMCMCVYSIFDWMRGFYTRFKDKKIVYIVQKSDVFSALQYAMFMMFHTGPHNHMPVNSNPSTWSTQTNSTPYQFGPMPILPPTSSVPCHFSYKTICSQSQFGQIRTKLYRPNLNWT